MSPSAWGLRVAHTPINVKRYMARIEWCMHTINPCISFTEHCDINLALNISIMAVNEWHMIEWYKCECIYIYISEVNSSEFI